MSIIGYIAPSDLLESNTLDFSLYSIITRASNILGSFCGIFILLYSLYLLLYYLLTPVEFKGAAIYV